MGLLGSAGRQQKDVVKKMSSFGCNKKRVYMFFKKKQKKNLKIGWAPCLLPQLDKDGSVVRSSSEVCCKTVLSFTKDVALFVAHFAKDSLMHYFGRGNYDRATRMAAETENIGQWHLVLVILADRKADGVLHLSGRACAPRGWRQ